jgi:hypothetical protein
VKTSILESTNWLKANGTLLDNLKFCDSLEVEPRTDMVLGAKQLFLKFGEWGADITKFILPLIDSSLEYWSVLYMPDGGR